MQILDPLLGDARRLGKTRTREKPLNSELGLQKRGDRANHLEFIGSSSRGLEIFFSIKF